MGLSSKNVLTEKQHSYKKECNKQTNLPLNRDYQNYKLKLSLNYKGFYSNNFQQLYCTFNI